MSNITQSQRMIDEFKRQIEALARRNDTSQLLEGNTDYVYFKYIEEGYTPPQALKHLHFKSQTPEDSAFTIG